MKHPHNALMQWVEDGKPLPGPKPFPGDWRTSEGRIDAIWSRVRAAGGTDARRMELLFCRVTPVLPIITAEEFAVLWERCQESGTDS